MERKKIMSTYFFYKESEPVPFFYLTPSRMAGQLPPPYESAMTPSAYLEFSITDLSDGSTRGLVNAFGNAKRALHLAIDTLLHQYGLFTHFRKSNFPDKLRLLDSIGILPITIMENLNVERNLLEHEYATPPKKRVAEAVDVTRLLLLATEKLLEATPFEVIVGWRNPKQHIVLQLEPVQGLLNLYVLRAKGQFGKIHGISCFRGRLRKFTGEALNPGIKISKKPWKVITLNKAEMNEWKPILTELVNVQRKQTSRETFVDKEAGFVTTSITFPLPLLKDRSWADIMDSILKKQMEKDEKKREDETQKTGAKEQDATS
jgi:hypothetical protein